MKSMVTAAAVVSIMALACGVQAQDQGAVAVAQTEAVVKVIKIDRKARTVTFRGPKGNTRTLNVPKEAQNFDRVKVGSTFKVRYVEAVAVAMQRGGTPSASADHQVRLAPKGGTPGGVVVKTVQLTAKVEAIDYATRALALKGPKGNVVALTVADEVQGLDQIKVGDTVGVAYAQALALEMLPEAGGKAKAAPAPK
jgi:Cu/Ag efflux protein CusF